MSKYSKIIDLLVSTASIFSFTFYFLFPHVALASYIGANQSLKFDFSNRTKIPVFALNKTNTSASLEKSLENKNGSNKINQRVLAVISSEEPKEQKGDNINAGAGKGIEDGALSAKTAIYTKEVLITAYSSTPDQTDDSPFITASNTHVRDGVVAANFLPFKTKIRIPKLFGDKIFTVEDRMRSNVKVDIWFPTRQEALNFGARRTQIEIVYLPY